MKNVSDFPIGVGEIYRDRWCGNGSGAWIFLEVLSVKRNLRGRQITSIMIDGRTCERVGGTERLHFGAGDFLDHYKPATAEDFK